MRCPLCAVPAPPAALVKAGYPIARCACGMMFVSRPVEEHVLESLYAEHYFAGGLDDGVPGYSGYADDERILQRNFARRLRALERLVTPGALLDVGCALGFFVRVARQRGWDACGVDRSAYAAGQAAARGVPVVHGDFLTAPFAPAGLAAVTMLDVLEHVADPRAYVRRARGLLRPGGVLLVETGDVGSLFARLSGRHYHFFSPPNHLTFFTRATLGRLLREEGFTRVAFFRVGKWVRVRQILYHLHGRARRPAVKRALRAAVTSRLARAVIPLNLGDDLLALARA